MEGGNMTEGQPRSIKDVASSKIKSVVDNLGNRLGILPLVPVVEGGVNLDTSTQPKSPEQEEKGGNRFGLRLGLPGTRKKTGDIPEGVNNPSNSTATSPGETRTNRPVTDADREAIDKQVEEALKKRQTQETTTDQAVDSGETASLTRFDRLALQATAHPVAAGIVGVVGATGAATAIGGLVWGINEIVENRVAIHQQVKDIGSGISGYWTENPDKERGPKKVPYDNTARIQEITEKNRNTIPLDQLPKEGLSSSYDPEKKIFTQVLPLVVPEGTTIKILNEENPNTGPSIPTRNKRISFEDENGDPVPGVGIMVAEEGWRYLIRKGNEKLGYDPNRAGSISLIKYFPEHDKTVVMQLMDPSISLKANFDSMSHEQAKGLTIEDYFSTLPLAPIGEELVETTADTAKPLISFNYVYDGRTVGSQDANLVRDVESHFLQDATGEIMLVGKS
jgi:hypothetical protein